MVFNSLIHANRELTSANRGQSVSRRGGASALAAVVERDFLALAGAGLCSARLFRGTEDPVLINRPHSYISMRRPRKEAGLAVSDSKMQDVPLMALGLYDDFEPEILELHAEPGDWVMLHTDGISPNQMQACVEARAEWLTGGDPAGLLSRLQESLSRGGDAAGTRSEMTDNSSFLLLFF